jgi:hypothetical protein
MIPKRPTDEELREWWMAGWLLGRGPRDSNCLLIAALLHSNAEAAATRGNTLTEYELRLACNRIGISFDQVRYALGIRDTSLAVLRKILIDPLSLCSLLVETRGYDLTLGTATAFCVRKGGNTLLITNLHVVTGRNADIGELLSSIGAVPDQIRILHHAKHGLGNWVIRTEALYIDGVRRWYEHPKGQAIDVIALPITVDGDVTVYELDLSLADFDMVVRVAMPVSIIGFPLERATTGMMPIWQTGHIASDPDMDYEDRPVFLIDATTRGGMSGSPVVLRIYGDYATIGGKSWTRFLGVYSGRIHDQTEIGRVWRPSVIKEILATVPSTDGKLGT